MVDVEELDDQLAKEFEKIHLGEHLDPHAFLGLCERTDGQKVIRTYQTDQIELFGKKCILEKVHRADFFEIEVPKETSYLDYRILNEDGIIDYDPYAFLPSFKKKDAEKFRYGVHEEIYDALGGRICSHQGIVGAKFALWAPNARGVSLSADASYPMRQLYSSGVWEIFIPSMQPHQIYTFQIKTSEGHEVEKSDPYALYFEKRPAHRSILFDTRHFEWTDEDWIDKRGDPLSKPLNVYEVHLASWKGGKFPNYRDIAVDLAAYCLEMGYTHIEILPLSEHPLDESWGYQVTGFYGITSRYGTPEDFQYFVNYFHEKGLGVILDWVPAHFPTDQFALAQFDGTHLYEYEDPRKGFHPHWNTYIFDYGKPQVVNFLTGSALYLLKYFHLDGLRVDAVASMLYLDYGRKKGEWIPNKDGGKHNLEAIAFLKQLNRSVHRLFDGVMMIAEESTAFAGITDPADMDFDLKWHMGWMHESLQYIQKDYPHRSKQHKNLTIGMTYAFSEKFILVLSHDEIVHGKKSLLSKMPGNEWQKFANQRLLMSYMFCYIGKNLLFMGGEFGQWGEWNCKEGLQWSLLEAFYHRALRDCIKALNHFYLENAALWEKDSKPKGFSWIDHQDTENSVISYIRRGKEQKLICIHHFSPNELKNYFISCKNITKAIEIFNTDHKEYGGFGMMNPSIEITRGKGFYIDLPPISTLILEADFDD